MSHLQFGIILSNILHNRKLSQKWLADQSGLLESALSKIINGKQSPDYTQIRAICEALNVPPSLFFPQMDNVGDELFGGGINSKVYGSIIGQGLFIDSIKKVALVRFISLMEHKSKAIVTLNMIPGDKIFYACHKHMIKWLKEDEVVFELSQGDSTIREYTDDPPDTVFMKKGTICDMYLFGNIVDRFIVMAKEESSEEYLKSIIF